MPSLTSVAYRSLLRPSRLSMDRALELGRLLRRWRSRRGLSRREAITELNKLGVDISYSYLAKLESGQRSLAVATLAYREGLRSLYRVSQDEWERETALNVPMPNHSHSEAVLSSPDLQRGSRLIEVFDLLSAGPGTDGGVVVDAIDIPESWTGPHAAYRVTGDSMIPEIKDGSTVVVRVQDYATPGNIVVAWSPEHGMVVKLLSRVEADGTHMLTSLNPAYGPLWARELRIYGVVRETRNPIKTFNGNHAPN